MIKKKSKSAKGWVKVHLIETTVRIRDEFSHSTKVVTSYDIHVGYKGNVDIEVYQRGNKGERNVVFIGFIPPLRVTTRMNAFTKNTINHIIRLIKRLVNKKIIAYSSLTISLQSILNAHPYSNGYFFERLQESTWNFHSDTQPIALKTKTVPFS